MRLRVLLRVLPCAVLLGLLAAPSWARDFMPRDGAQVLERLAPRVRAATASPEAATAAAQQAVLLARQSSDPRYLGRAEALLAPWWDRSDAPVAVAVLQATVQQARHEFEPARRTLQAALSRDAQQPQGWLTLATLERVAGRYAAAQAACQQVARGGALLHAAACMLETQSLQGRFDAARRGFAALRTQADQADVRAWLDSLRAENEERAGRDTDAALAYEASLAAAPGDTYTALAAADLHLRLQRPAAALQVLQAHPASDAVLLRRAAALRLEGDAQWQALSEELRQRFAALDARGDDPALHARERALAALWLWDDSARAWSAAQANLRVQREPLDWWLAFTSAQRAGDAAGLAQLRADLASTGLQDARLAALQVARR